MGNTPSACSAIGQRIEHGSKTGVCSLRELKLERVSTENLRYLLEFINVLPTWQKINTIHRSDMIYM